MVSNFLVLTKDKVTQCITMTV